MMTLTDMHIKHRIITWLLLGSLCACVKPYDFDAETFEKVLVVDGLVTNQPGPYKVEITYTYPLDTVLNEFVSGATVWVETGSGSRVDYAWSENGTYLSPTTFQGEVGETYQLFIEMVDGATYTSSAETLTPSPSIERIYGNYAQLPTSEGDRNTGGIQFFIDSQDESGTAKYFRYDWEEAYKIVTPYPATHRLIEEDSTLVPLDTAIGICYKENTSRELIYGSTIGSSENRMVEFPVRFVSEEAQTLRVRYSLLVKQYAITEAAYLFYKRLTENNESGGSLFDRQTGSIFGNISPLDNPDQAVLGFFEVSGVSEKRAFFSAGELDEKLNTSGYLYFCSAQEIIETVPDSAAYYLHQTGGNVFGYSPMPPAPVVYIHYKSCTDCSFYADTTPPDYWID